MAQELLCDRGFFCCDCACGERCYSLLFCAKFFLLGKDRAGAFVARARPAASNPQRRQLDAASGAIRRPASSNFFSPHCPGWASRTQRAPRNQSVQSPTAFLLTFFPSFFLIFLDVGGYRLLPAMSFAWLMAMVAPRGFPRWVA
jgi:hypothetical protein